MRGDGDCQPASHPASQPPAQEGSHSTRPVGPAADSPPTPSSYLPERGGRCRPLLQAVMLCEAWCTKGPKESERDLSWMALVDSPASCIRASRPPSIWLTWALSRACWE